MQKNSIQTLSKLAVPLKSKGRFFKEKKTYLLQKSILQYIVFMKMYSCKRRNGERMSLKELNIPVSST